MSSLFPRVWLQWKSLRLPWRKQYLIGEDLHGNTYWEFRDTLQAKRWRRIVRYPKSVHPSEVRVPPLWHHWLRHGRQDPPSLEEQVENRRREEKIKVLAAEIDAKWKREKEAASLPPKQ